MEATEKKFTNSKEYLKIFGIKIGKSTEGKEVREWGWRADRLHMNKKKIGLQKIFLVPGSVRYCNKSLLLRKNILLLISLIVPNKIYIRVISFHIHSSEYLLYIFHSSRQNENFLTFNWCERSEGKLTIF